MKSKRFVFLLIIIFFNSFLLGCKKEETKIEENGNFTLVCNRAEQMIKDSSYKERVEIEFVDGKVKTYTSINDIVFVDNPENLDSHLTSVTESFASIFGLNYSVKAEKTDENIIRVTVKGDYEELTEDEKANVGINKNNYEDIKKYEETGGLVCEKVY